MASEPSAAPPLPNGEFQFPPLPRLLKRLGLRTHQQRGQHFLRRPELGDRIVESAQLDPEDWVVEIGAGLGNLSVPLARRVRRVFAVEPDRRFEPWHTHLQFFFKNLSFHYMDFLEAPVAEWTTGVPHPVAVGNLPYYLTSPILFHLLEGPIRWRRIVVMVQKEVADRMVASPGSKVYSGLSLKCAYYSMPKITLAVPPGEFTPVPKVHSRIVVLDPRPDPLGGDTRRRRRIFDLIEIAFQHRRKTLVNALLSGGWWPQQRTVLEEAIRSIGIDPVRRPETIALDEFFAIEDSLRRAGF